MTGSLIFQKYPDSLKLFVYEDFNSNTVYHFLANNFSPEALTIAELYREMANWAVLQMDKAVSAYKDILRNHSKCRVHTDMDSYL